ncbi:MAG: biotin synthase BioB [Candidatus Omnitrophica bacterium]|nr:biotin synthase BioB [Candidatus Omnitrophota bacterium]
MNIKDLDSLLKTPLPELIPLADRLRKDLTGKRLELCSIVNAKSGSCGEDCKFCAQSSRHSCEVSTYPLKEKSEIIDAAKRASEIGSGRFGIVTSGNKLTPAELDVITDAIAEINSKVGIPLCASLGALSGDDLKKLKEAGLSRYHHNIETSPRFYSQIVSTHSFKERVDTIHAAKSVGLELCSGGILGMGETWQDRIDMALLLKELNVDSIPINLLVPIKGTALGSIDPISCADAVRSICIFRIILKDKTIKIAAGRESVLKDFQALGFMAGANGMLIDGYLTVGGRGVEEDRKLAEEIEKLWEE